MRAREGVEAFFEPPVGHWRFGAFPPTSLLIGMAFEVGGTYEDWGWIMYEKEYVPDSASPKTPALYRLRTFATGRRLPDLLKHAEEEMERRAAIHSLGEFLCPTPEKMGY